MCNAIFAYIYNCFAVDNIHLAITDTKNSWKKISIAMWHFSAGFINAFSLVVFLSYQVFPWNIIKLFCGTQYNRQAWQCSNWYLPKF